MPPGTAQLADLLAILFNLTVWLQYVTCVVWARLA